MLSKRWIALLGSACFVLASGAAAQDEEEEDLSDEPERCLSMASIRSTRVIDDHTVLFFHGRGNVYVNRLERQCVGLARNGKFTYQVHTGARHSRLCATDTITVLERTGRGFNCDLGWFEQISRDEADSYLAGPNNAAVAQPVELPPEEDEPAPAREPAPAEEPTPE